MMFWFPCICFVETKGLMGQIAHIEQELEEFAVELERKDLPVAMIELLDLRHSIETCVRILQRSYGAGVVEPFDLEITSFSPEAYLRTIRDRFSRFWVSATNDHSPVVLGHLLSFLQAVDTEVALMEQVVGYKRPFIGAVIKKNLVRGYYDAKCL